MQRSYLTSSVLEHLGIADCLFNLLEHTDLARDWHFELFVG